MRNTNFVGDFEAIWLLTKNGEFRLRGYNQTNDRYFTKSTLTTQGIGIMYKKDFMNWKELVDWFLRRRKNRSSKQKEKEDQKYLPQEALPAAREKENQTKNNYTRIWKKPITCPPNGTNKATYSLPGLMPIPTGPICSMKWKLALSALLPK